MKHTVIINPSRVGERNCEAMLSYPAVNNGNYNSGSTHITNNQGIHQCNQRKEMKQEDEQTQFDQKLQFTVCINKTQNTVYKVVLTHKLLMFDAATTFLNVLKMF